MSNTESSHSKRSFSVVDRDVQFGILRAVATHWIVLHGCNFLGLFTWVRLLEYPELGWAVTFEECCQRYLPFFIVSLALVPVFVFDTLKMSNRFAGPISRLRQELRNAVQGQPVSKLQFRSNDYWREIAHGFNAMAAKAGLVEKQTQ